MARRLTIYSPERTVFDGEVTLVELPGSKGRFEVLRGHDALISTLTAGHIRYVSAPDGQETRQPVAGGYAEVRDDRIAACVTLPRPS